MTLMALLIRLRASGIGLYVTGDKLRVSAPANSGALSDDVLAAIKAHKEALKDLPRPYLNAAGELVVPSHAPPQYHWQPTVKTLQELCAPHDV